jgi:SAM-dependent methyltransferase
MNTSSRILLAIDWSPEFREAPEFRWLQRWVKAQAERVWDEVETVDDLCSFDPEAPLLIVGERCLLGRRTLEAMRQAIEAGVTAVVPRRLAESGLPDLHRIRTLRGIERAEETALSRAGNRAAVKAPYPAVLVSRQVVSELDHPSLASILGGDDLPVEPAVAGLCHEFIDYYGEVRDDILPLLGKDCRDVLEVGCGRGSTGAFLQEKLGCKVTGVELNPVVARAAAERLHRVIVGDVLTIDPGETFDVVVACELFEHLTEGEVFLERVRRWIRPGGRAVLSVPNVGHHSIVEDLLAGRWDYLPVGLLCSTHYRFYTRRTLEDMLHAAGLHDFEIIPQSAEPPEWLDGLPDGVEIDAESLATHGFYVVIYIS